MKKTIITFMIKLVVFASILVVVDQLTGMTFNLIRQYVFNSNPFNPNNKTPFMVEKVNTDIVIVGASDASRHYIPRLISDSLNMTVYNCGQDGCYFLYQNCLINLMLQRYSPKIIIWQFSADYLCSIFNSKLEYQSISGLYPYYDDNYCRKLINDKDEIQQYRMLSKMYRNNSKIHSYAYSFLKRDNYDSGYEPLDSSDHEFPSKFHEETHNDICEAKVERLENTIENIKNHRVKLIFASSPRYTEDNVRTLAQEKLKEICKKHGIPYIDSFDNKEAYQDAALFKDANHLNDKGARVYMQWFIPQLKRSLHLDYCNRTNAIQ